MRPRALVLSSLLSPSLGRFLAGCVLLLMVVVYVMSRERAPVRRPAAR